MANERRLGQVIGTQTVGKLHTGRSRNDQVVTACVCGCGTSSERSRTISSLSFKSPPIEQKQTLRPLCRDTLAARSAYQMVSLAIPMRSRYRLRRSRTLSTSLACMGCRPGVEVEVGSLYFVTWWATVEPCGIGENPISYSFFQFRLR